MSIRYFYLLPAHAISFVLIMPHNTDNFFPAPRCFSSSIPIECVTPALVQLVSPHSPHPPCNYSGSISCSAPPKLLLLHYVSRGVAHQGKICMVSLRPQLWLCRRVCVGCGCLSLCIHNSQTAPRKGLLLRAMLGLAPDVSSG